MKISNFKAIIREAVKEELRASLPKLLKEHAAMGSKKPPVRKSEFMTGISHAMGLQDKVKRPSVKRRKNYSNTMSLTEALADTASTGQRVPQDGSYQTMDKMFTSVDVPQTSASPDGRPIDMDNVSAEVVNNLTKDYSQLMQKVNEKSAARKA
jgi:hypothetical protein